MNPDQQVSDERAHFYSKAAALVGRRVLEVRYWDVHNFSDEPNTWDYGDWHHAVMGVEVFPAPVSEHILDGESGPESWDASGSDRWRPRLNSLVAGVQTFWEHITVGPGHIGDVRVLDPYEVDVPVALRIDFAAGPVWMVAGIP